jgi:hypothetical protein
MTFHKTALVSATVDQMRHSEYMTETTFEPLVTKFRNWDV